MAAVREFPVTVDRADPERVARFRCEVLGYVLATPRGFDSWDASQDWLPSERRNTGCACVDPTGTGPDSSSSASRRGRWPGCGCCSPTSSTSRLW